MIKDINYKIRINFNIFLLILLVFIIIIIVIAIANIIFKKIKSKNTIPTKEILYDLFFEEIEE